MSATLYIRVQRENGDWEPKGLEQCSEQEIIRYFRDRDARELLSWCAYLGGFVKAAGDFIPPERLRAAVDASCSCGGKGADEPGVCPACMVWHRLNSK